MRKAITICAIAGLAMTSEVQDNELGIRDVIRKGANLVANNPNAVAGVARAISKIADDEELIFPVGAIAKAHSFFKGRREEESDEELINIGAIVKGVKTGIQIHNAIKNRRDEEEETSDEELLKIGKILSTAVKIGSKFLAEDEELINVSALVKGVKTGIKVHQAIKDLRNKRDEEEEETSDEELIKIGKILGTAIKIGSKFLAEDEELINIGGIIKGVKTGIQIHNAIKNRRDEEEAGDNVFLGF